MRYTHLVLSKIRRVIRMSAAVLIVITAYCNIFDLSQRSIDNLPPRDSSPTVAQGSRFGAVLKVLRENGYLEGKLGFVTSTQLAGKVRTPQDDEMSWKAK